MYTWLLKNHMDIFSQDAKLLEIKTLYNSPIGILYNKSIKTIAQVMDILKSKILYSVPNLEMSMDEFYSKLYLCDGQTNTKLDLETNLQDTSGKLYLSLTKNKYFFDKGYFEELKANEFPKYFNTPNSIAFYIKDLVGKTTIIHAELGTTIEMLKYKIYDEQGTPIDQQRLIFSGHQLENKFTLEDYQVTECSTIQIVLRLRGGMLHEVSGRNGYSQLSGLIIYDAIKNKFIDC